jgi:hypothetical protein
MAEYILRSYIRKMAMFEMAYTMETQTDAAVVLRLIEDVPAADVAPVVHGRWIPQHESEITGWNPEFAGRDPIGSYICSECKHEAVYDCNDEFVLSEYCPYCGVKMDGGADDEKD